MRTDRPALLAAVCFIVAGLTGCETTGSRTTSSGASDAAAKPVLRVGVARTAPPLVFVRDGETVGLEADLARRLGDELGMQVEFVPTFFPNLIMQLRGGHIDIIMAGMTVTEDRARRIAFTDPYLTVGQVAVVQTGEASLYPTGEAIRQTRRKVGVEIGSTGENFARENMPQARVTGFPTVAKAFDALRAGAVGMVIYDSPAAEWEVTQQDAPDLIIVGEPLTREQLAWAVQKDETELHNRVNRALAKWKTDGTLNATIAKWIRTR